MRIDIIDSSKECQYIELLNLYSLNLDIYYDFNFLSCEAKLQAGELEIFIAHDSNKILVYPYIRLPFNTDKWADYSDIISPYGYAGPATNSSDKAFLDKAEETLIKYLIESKTVTEFVRYHYDDSVLFEKNIQNEINRSIVVLSLSQEWESVWENEFSSKNRNLIRKLQKEGYVVEEWTEDAAVDEFSVMYNSTMDNVGASEYYYFSSAYLRSLKKNLRNKLRLYRVVKDKVIYSTSLFFFVNGKVNYYLSARNLTFPQVPATNYLLAQVAEIALKEGYICFNLGGGTTSSEDDSLLKFKQNFSKKRATFKVGKRIHLPKVYKKLQQDYISSHGSSNFEKKRGILQFYRT